MDDAPRQGPTMHRRGFLGAIAAGAGATALAACTSSGGSDAEGTSAKPGPLTTADRSTATTPPKVPAATGIASDPFQLGVASGDPLPASVILWTRLATDLEDPSGNGGLGTRDHQVLWEVAKDEAFDDVVATDLADAPGRYGHSVHAEATDLDPDTWYWYRFRIGDHTSPTGRTRTAPADGADVDQLKVAFASCQLRTAGHWTAYPHLVEDAPDLVMFLGDYIYEYPGGEGDLKIPLDAEPQDLADYRVLYAAYKKDERIQAAHAVAPWVVTWDDHEVENNYAAAIPEHDEDRPTFATRRKAAYQAFWEHHAVRMDPPAKDGSLQVYRSFRWGNLADVFVLDGRQYRSDQVCGDKVGTNATECTELDDASHTMLGKVQEQWLDDGLAGSEATWRVLAQQTVMHALKIGDIVLNVDQWDGYPQARARLLESIEAGKIDNVVVLTGDIHAGGAADIRSPNADLEGTIVATEIVGTSISSPGFGAIVGDIDLSSLGLHYANFRDHGYARCTITPTTWRTDFVVVDTIEDETSSARVDATVEVKAGTPGMRRL
ncbi:MAG: alkaline phosphatase D family protein [Acidimicrobiales bacterium]